ncbi:MAG: hypothetical protein IJR34_02635, partial [Bacteroidales bacterium]|nr:hypothetical protein [Bacteroidales bacterium]
RVLDGLEKYLASPSPHKSLNIKKILAVSEDWLLAIWDKKATPIEGWSVSEDFRRENGADSYTLSPSGARI